MRLWCGTASFMLWLLSARRCWIVAQPHGSWSGEGLRWGVGLRGGGLRESRGEVDGMVGERWVSQERKKD